MQVSRVAGWMFVGAVATAWLASAAGVTRSARQAPRVLPASADAVALDSLVSDVQTQASRLRKRLESAPSPKAPSRNPFSFAERAAAPPRAPRQAPPPAYVPPPVVPVEPSLQLIGIAEKKVGEGIVRTAMLSPGDADALIMATAGQKILGAYEVVAVSADAVQLKDLVTGATRTLILK